MKYGVISDLHNHAWSLFSTTDKDGVNSRLKIIIRETERAAAAVKAAGGDVLVIAGDIFHTRGIMDPEVLNPVRESFENIRNGGMRIFAIPGNHDLKTRDARELSSAITNLVKDQNPMNRFLVFNQTKIIPFTPLGMFLAFVPWCETKEELLKQLEQLALHSDKALFDVFIHAGIDGVLSGVPASGLTAKTLSDFGFRNVFAGHYHNQRDMGGNVYSIGATTHHGWGDIGTRAGFLMVDSDTGSVEFRGTSAPLFIDISGMSEEDMEMEVSGNYVRYRGSAMTQSQIAEFRDQLTKWGALGVSIQVPPAIVSARPATGSAKKLTLDESLKAYIDEGDFPAHLPKEEILKRAQSALDRARIVVEET